MKKKSIKKKSFRNKNKEDRKDSKIVLSLVFLVLFLFLMNLVTLNNRIINSIDSSAENYSTSIRNGFLTSFMKIITDLGDWKIIFVLTAIIAAFLLYRKKLKHLFVLILSVVAGEGIIWTIKNLVERARPDVVNALVYESSYSFPSGHAFISLSFYALIMYFVYKSSESKTIKTITVIASLLIVFLIGVSRVYLGVHWISDVVAGSFLGICWVFLMIFIFKSIK